MNDPADSSPSPSAGLLGFAGVYLNWFRYSYAVTGGTIDVYLRGSEDWTGQVAFIAGIAAFAFAVANISCPTRRSGG